MHVGKGKWISGWARWIRATELEMRLNMMLANMRTFAKIYRAKSTTSLADLNKQSISLFEDLNWEGCFSTLDVRFPFILSLARSYNTSTISAIQGLVTIYLYNVFGLCECLPSVLATDGLSLCLNCESILAFRRSTLDNLVVKRRICRRPVNPS